MLADQYNSQYPDACSSIKTEFYVYDLLTGSDDLDQLQEKCSTIKNQLASAGFIILMLI